VTDTLQSRVAEDVRGERLPDWLARRFTYFDAGGWLAEIEAGRVFRNGSRACADDPLAAGDVVAFRPDGAAPAGEITILHEDADLVAIDKPAHFVAHRDSAFPRYAFLRELERRCATGAEPAELHLAHRLDRDTSGVLLLARGPDVVARLQQRFAAGDVEKRYLAIVHGRVAGQRFTIDAPIGRARSPLAVRRAVVAAGSPGARAARTEIEVVERLAGCTLVAARPRTGRTHQIRVHLEHAGHPLVGDKLYVRTDEQYLAYVGHLKAGGDPCWGELPAGRHLLHAQRLRLPHPRSGAWLELEAPLPADFAAHLAGVPPA
jgi:RluA family pseudouridine synthase